jgi:hypothetical protein
MKKARPGEGGGPRKAKDNKGFNSLSTDPARSARAADRPHFLLVLRPEPGIDGIRALRRFLKTALRRFRLRCISAEQRL